MSTAIVVLNVTQTSAPAPSNQQQIGAFVSQGATSLAPNTKQLLTQPSDLAAILKGALALSTVAWSGSIVTGTTAAPHGIPNGDIVKLTITGVTPTGYNGTFQCTSTGANTFTYPLVSNPGAQTVAGVYTPEDVAELVAMNTTFWAQGSQAPVYVLELGLDGTPQGVTDLGTYINNNTVNGVGPFYAYLLPRSWASEGTLPAFIATFEALNKMTYFFVTADNSSYTNFTNVMKSASVMIEATSGLPTTEFSHASDFRALIGTKPSASNRVTPYRFKNMLGVTAYLQPGNGALIDTYLTGGNNLILTGAEGGLSSTILRNGTTKDGRDYQYWYSVDWTQINLQRDLAAAIIDGSNNALNPLYYNQDGINRLQAVIANVLARGASFGMIAGAPVQVQLDPADFTTKVENGDYAGLTPVNAQPFIAYSEANPNDFAAGIYAGFQIAMTPNRGFSQIIIGLNVTDFVTGA